MVDEAHATGIFGKNGAGIVEEFGLEKEVELVMGTFSKALGCFGAYLAASREIVDFLVNTCRSFIYSTALPPAVIAADIESIDIVRDEPLRRQRLLDSARYFRERLQEKGFRVEGASQIVPLILGENEKAVIFSRKLQEKGFWVLPIRPPTVPKGNARLRFSFTYNHSREIVDKLIKDILNVGF
jgi:7-keto-8-aminopelargonate synthetase-like enzyme